MRQADHHADEPDHSVARAEIEHPTAKPVEFYDLVEGLCPAPRYLDLLSRYRQNDKWDCYGDDAPAMVGRAMGKPTLVELVRNASSILRRARIDPVTGLKLDKRYRSNKRAERKIIARHNRKRTKKLGKFGAPLQHAGSSWRGRKKTEAVRAESDMASPPIRAPRVVASQALRRVCG